MNPLTSSSGFRRSKLAHGAETLLWCGVLSLFALASGTVQPRHRQHRTLQRVSAERLTHNVPASVEVQEMLRGSAKENGSVVNVVSFGGRGDGSTDNTRAFQACLDALAPSGGICFVPAGNYSFLGTLRVPVGVAMVGTSECVTDAPGRPGGTAHTAGYGGSPNTGSILLVHSGRGNETATPFVSLNENSALRGVTIYYPENVFDQVPKPYPWAVDLVGNDVAVLDCLLLNPWLGIRAVSAARHYIARVQGQPVKTGVFVDATYDM